MQLIRIVPLIKIACLITYIKTRIKKADHFHVISCWPSSPGAFFMLIICQIRMPIIIMAPKRPMAEMNRKNSWNMQFPLGRYPSLPVVASFQISSFFFRIFFSRGVSLGCSGSDLFASFSYSAIYCYISSSSGKILIQLQSLWSILTSN